MAKTNLKLCKMCKRKHRRLSLFCSKICADKNYRINHKFELKEYFATRWIRDKKKLQKYYREYYIKNKNRIKRINKIYRILNAKKVALAKRRYSINNREYVTESRFTPILRIGGGLKSRLENR